MVPTMDLLLRPYWFDLERRRPLLPEGGKPPPGRCEAAVVGGGTAGLAAALHLARAGTETVLFEAGRLGEGATGRSDGQVLLATGEHPSRLVGQLGEERAGLLFACMQANAGFLAGL